MKLFRSLSFKALALCLWLAQGSAMANEYDVHTLSNYYDIWTKSLFMNLTVDMDQKIVSGYVDHFLKHDGMSDQFIVDTRGLVIEKTAISSVESSLEVFEEIEFEVDESLPILGSALKIPIFSETRVVRVHYHTTETSDGLSWLPPELTSDGFPMLFTQFEPIKARTVLPLQDTPAKKFEYSADIKLISSVEDDRMQLVMAAMEREDLGGRRFRFDMTHSVPPYLIAWAAGVFEEREISPRVKVITEASRVDKAAQDFANTEIMIVAAEKILGPYDWKRFDPFIAPLSFPFGAMENPTLPFFSATIVKSLEHVIAHEIAHSWAGNLLTNKNWNHFWINQGITTYIERKILRELHIMLALDPNRLGGPLDQEHAIQAGQDAHDLAIKLGQQILKHDIEEVLKLQGSHMTRLALEMAADFDPEEAITHIPYEKGANFWLAMERAYGEKTVLDFLKLIFEKYAFQSIDSNQLKKEMMRYPSFAAHTIDIDDWFSGQGLPNAGLPKVTSALIDQAKAFTKNINDEEMMAEAIKYAQGFNTEQWSYVLHRLEVSPKLLHSLNDRFGLTAMNKEVEADFYVSAIKTGLYYQYREQILDYISQIGRIKYIKPIYGAMLEAGLRDEAVETYQQSIYNPITSNAIKSRLGL